MVRFDITRLKTLSKYVSLKPWQNEDITVGNAVAELPAVHENIFQLIWNLNLELFSCKRKLFPDRLQPKLGLQPLFCVCTF